MIGPKKTGGRRIFQNKEPDRHCQNCGGKITGRGKKYCDTACKLEHYKKLKAERRPKEINCTYCGKPLDPLSRTPYKWERSKEHFCDDICAAGWKEKSGQLAEMSQVGNKAIQAYKEKHGSRQNHKERAQKTSELNKTHHPKSKLYVRTGKVWGYDARVVPNEAKDGYIAYIPELEKQINPVEAKTVRKALELLRARFLEIRAQEQQ